MSKGTRCRPARVPLLDRDRVGAFPGGEPREFAFEAGDDEAQHGDVIQEAGTRDRIRDQVERCDEVEDSGHHEPMLAGLISR